MHGGQARKVGPRQFMQAASQPALDPPFGLLIHCLGRSDAVGIIAYGKVTEDRLDGRRTRTDGPTTASS